MLQPMVSIVIPVYNGSNYLKCAIDSALNQTYTNCEIIVVDDGSQDNGATKAIALSYGDKIKYFFKKNGGVATALNMGIQKMQGEYFSWLSHDDMYYPEKIEEEILAIQKSGNMTAIVFSDYDVLNMESKSKYCLSIGNSYSKEKIQSSLFPVLQGLIHGCSLLIHKNHFNRVGMFDVNLITTQDYDLWFRLFRNQKLIFIEKPLIVSRIHEKQGSKTISDHEKEQSQMYINFINKLNTNEIKELYGNKYIFYYEIMSFLWNQKIMRAYEYARNLFEKEDTPREIEVRIESLKETISKISNYKAKKICIFCAGYYGLIMYRQLKCRGININYYSDNNPKKWGTEIEGIKCVPLIEINREDTLIIVAIKDSDEIVEQLIMKGFNYVVTKQQLDEMILSVPPIKELAVMEFKQ